jgi:hypothetical protein
MANAKIATNSCLAKCATSNNVEKEEASSGREYDNDDTNVYNEIDRDHPYLTETWVSKFIEIVA